MCLILVAMDIVNIAFVEHTLVKCLPQARKVSGYVYVCQGYQACIFLRTELFRQCGIFVFHFICVPSNYIPPTCNVQYIDKKVTEYNDAMCKLFIFHIHGYPCLLCLVVSYEYMSNTVGIV